MFWAGLARYEWLIVELGVVGLLVAELISVNRSIRRAKDEKPDVPPG